MISIEGYADIERIGQGGLGDVYRARRESTGATVAIKVLRDVSDESTAWHRTRRELTALVALQGHGHVVQLLEVLDLPEGPALVMEYAPGGSVADMMLRRDEPLSVGETVLVGRQIATALTAAHRQGIVHRDVKPQNLLIDAYGQVKLCDFGIAAMTRSEEFQVRTSAISMRYASPEDLEDEPDVGPASDVYSLGATMLHMARGAPPTLKERLSPWVPPPTDDPELAALDRIMAGCLHPTPARRPAAADLADDLERLGWSIDERNRSIAFGPAGHTDDDDPTEVRPSSASGSSAPASTAAVSPRVDAPSTPSPSPPTGRSNPIGTGLDEDATVLRADRPAPPPRPEPVAPPSSGRRRRVIAVVVGAVVLVGGALAVNMLVGGDDEGASLTFVDRPAGLPALDTLDWPLGTTPACFVQADDRLDTVDCDEAHDLQRIGGGDLSSDDVGSESFDLATVRTAVRDACETAFVGYVGVSPTDSDLDLPIVAPSEATWAEGDRSYGCFVAVPGRRIVGDAAG